MIDLFESIIKSHSVVILSEYVKHNRLSESAKGMVASGLRTPSLGTWQLLSHVRRFIFMTDIFGFILSAFVLELVGVYQICRILCWEICYIRLILALNTMIFR
jgi:hypothetical protein